MLFWALLLCVTHLGRIKELDEYARKVIKEDTPSELTWPKDNRPLYQASSIYSPLIHAHREVAWTEGALDAVGLAMQGWRGEGYIKGLKGSKLKHYIAKPPLGPRVDRRTTPPPRYRSAAVVRVARLLVDHGPRLRRLLNLTESSAEAKPMHVILQELEAQNEQLKANLQAEQKNAKRLQDAWRKAADRLKNKNRAATEARRDERSKASKVIKEVRKEAKDASKEAKDAANRSITEHEATVRKEVEAIPTSPHVATLE